MSKDFNINAIYQGKSHIFQCPPERFLLQASQFYEINASNIEIYKIEKRSKIYASDLADLMKVEIILKKKPNSTHVQSDAGTSGIDSQVERIVDKLTKNNILTGRERQYVIDCLKKQNITHSFKRKWEDIDLQPSKCKMISKYVQSTPNANCFKTVSTQTDEASHSASLLPQCMNKFIKEEYEELNQANDQIIQYKSTHVQTDIVHSSGNGNLNTQTLQFQRVSTETNEEEDLSTKIKKLDAEEVRNDEEVAQLIQASFQERRRFILLESPLIISVEERYPLLFSASEFMNELDRIFYAGKCIEFGHYIKKYATAILDECEGCDVHSETMASIDLLFSEDQKLYAKAVGSILAVPTIMNESNGFLNALDNPIQESVYPYIDVPDYPIQEMYFSGIVYNIKAEGRLICKAQNFLDAVLCYFATFFIFSIDYPSSCKNTLIVFEKLYLRANETTEVDRHTEQMIKLLKIKTKFSRH